MGFLILGFVIVFVLELTYNNAYLLFIPVITLLVGGFLGCYLQGKSYLKQGKDALSKRQNNSEVSQ